MINPTSLAAWKTFRESSRPSDYCSDTLFTVRSGSEAQGVRELLRPEPEPVPRPLAASGWHSAARTRKVQEGASAASSPGQLHPHTGPLRNVLEGLSQAL